MTAKDGVETTIAGKHGPVDVHQLIRLNELQVWFNAEHVVNAPTVDAT